MNPLVSVVVPTYNRAEFLVQCLDSILAQTYRPVELIVVDDGSTDSTDALIKNRYIGKVEFIKRVHSGLPAVARNIGIGAAKGLYIAFCDSDDYWLPEKLEVQMQRLLQKRCTCSCSDAFLHGERGKTYLQDYRFVYRDYGRELLRENFIITSSVVLERSMLGNHLFDTSPRLRGYEDYVLWLTMGKSLSMDFIQEPLLWYRRHPESLSAASRRTDALGQMRILFSHPGFRQDPFVGMKKLLRLLRHLLP